MPTIINGTDNTAATPALTGTDTDTGVFFPAANTMAFSTGGAEAMRISSAGNVGIGAIPTAVLQLKNDVAGTAGTANMIKLYEGSGATFGFGVSAGALDYRGDAHLFYTNATTPVERMRIDSSGNVLVNRTTDIGNGVLMVSGIVDTRVAIQTYQNATSTQGAIWFNNPNGTVGQINTTGSSTAYSTSSDYRLKENIAPMTGALDVVSALKPVTYKWKVDGSSGQGFIAHELQEIVPDCVTGEKDAVETVDEFDEDGKKIGTKEVPRYQGIDTSFLVATLTAAIQELKATVDAQAARIAALESK